MMFDNEYSSLDHAVHNEETCKELDELKRYDWVVTTAFYSALHYLRHRIFPLEFDHQNNFERAECFDDYCIIIGEQGKKHSIFKKVVQNECPNNTSVDYNRMLDVSYSSRYRNYNVSVPVKNTILEKLDKIKVYSTEEIG